jgi:hypothetical protein
MQGRPKATVTMGTAQKSFVCRRAHVRPWGGPTAGARLAVRRGRPCWRHDGGPDQGRAGRGRAGTPCALGRIILGEKATGGVQVAVFLGRFGFAAAGAGGLPLQGVGTLPRADREARVRGKGWRSRGHAACDRASGHFGRSMAYCGNACRGKLMQGAPPGMHVTRGPKALPAQHQGRWGPPATACAHSPERRRRAPAECSAQGDPAQGAVGRAESRAGQGSSSARTTYTSSQVSSSLRRSSTNLGSCKGKGAWAAGPKRCWRGVGRLNLVVDDLLGREVHVGFDGLADLGRPFQCAATEVKSGKGKRAEGTS